MANDKDRLFEKIYFLWKGEGERRLRLRVTEREQPEHRLVLQRYGANIEEYRKWYQGISKSVKEVQIVGSPRSSEPPQADTETANEAMNHLREQQEAQIIVTTTDGNKKPKQAITSLTISLGNGLLLTRKGMSFDEFLTFAQNLKAKSFNAS